MSGAEPRWPQVTAALAGRLDGVQIADLLWLAQWLAPEIQRRSASSASTQAAEATAEPDGAGNLRGPAPEPTMAPEGSLAEAELGQATPPPKPPQREALVVPATGSGTSAPASPSVSIAEAGLLRRQRRRIQRALAPLDRPVERGPACLLDEKGTVEAIARARVDRAPWLPVLRPRREPWLSLHLLFDDHPSMALWHQLRRELPSTLLAQGSRWRDLRRWCLRRGAGGELELRGAHGRRCAPGQLRRPGGRDLVLVVSDAIAPCWRDGAMARQLQAWAEHEPVVLLQVLPPRLWPRTGLGQQEAGWSLTRRLPMPPNRFLAWHAMEADPGDEDEDEDEVDEDERGMPTPASFTLPLATLEPASLAALARLLTGAAGGSLRSFRFAPLVAAPPALAPAATPSSATTAPPTSAPSPTPDGQAIEQQLGLFLYTASLEARRLLGLLSYAPVITLPVVRLIQRQLASGGPAAIAEVLFSGLFSNVAAAPPAGAPRLPADRQRLCFVEEALRPRLRQGLRVGEARAVFDAVKAHVASSLNCGGVERFEAQLRQPPPPDGGSDWELLSAFATVAPSCLRGLGARYEELADAIERGWALAAPTPSPAEEPCAWVNALAVFADGRLASGSGDTTIRIWEGTGETCLATLTGHGKGVQCLAVLPDGRLASGSGDATIRVWDPVSGACGAVFEGHGGAVNCLGLLADGRLASGSDDQTLRLWDISNGECTLVLEGPQGPVNCMAPLADGRLAYGSNDGSIRIFDPVGRAFVLIREAHRDPVDALAVLADGRLASGSADRMIRLWDPISGANQGSFEGHGGAVSCLVALADGRLASGSLDHTIRLWEPRSGACLASFDGCGEPVRALALLGDGRLAIGAGDHTIRIWDPKAAQWPTLQPLLFETAALEEITLRRISFTTSTLTRASSRGFRFRALGNKPAAWSREDRQGEAWAFEEPDGPPGLTLLEIPAGRFTMGSPNDEPERYSDEGPQHELELRSFFMSQTPITQAQWRAVAGWTEQSGEQWGRELTPNPSRFGNEADSDQRPVERVSWLDAMEFCSRLSQRTGRYYTLPSEAQWEYACRAGSSTPFAFGATLSAELANYNATSTYGDGPKGEYRKQTTPVGMFPANAWGLHDMHGNVEEWCLDEWHWSYEGAPADGSAWVEGDDLKRVDISKRRLLRGGSWLLRPWGCRSAYRDRLQPDDADGGVGFRVVCLPQGPSLNP